MEEYKYCASCGEKIVKEAVICPKCGRAVEGAVMPSNQPASNNTVNNIPDEYKPISMWGYFGYELLFCIPCVGIILLLVFAFGGTQNINLKNFARSYFCLWIVIAILFLLLMSMGAFASMNW